MSKTLEAEHGLTIQSTGSSVHVCLFLVTEAGVYLPQRSSKPRCSVRSRKCIFAESGQRQRGQNTRLCLCEGL
jgi:hypothetical protein